MKKVINIINLIPTIMEVPNDWVKCSVSGEYRPPEEFMRDGKVCRTNCTRTFEMPFKEMNKLSAEVLMVTNGLEYGRLVYELHTERMYAENSISVSEMITHLQKLNPQDRLVVSKGARGGLGDVHQPEQDTIINGTQYYSIGTAI